MIAFLAACLLPAFCVSLAATAAMRRVAPRLGLIDKPAARKVHRAPTPMGGGVAVWFAVVPALAAVPAAAWLSRDGGVMSGTLLAQHAAGILATLPQLAALLGAATLLAAVGLYDDFRPLPWPPRLALQFAAAGLVVASGIRVTLFVEAPWFGAVVTLFWIVGLVNSFNFLDNMNGLTSGVAAVAACVLAAVVLTALPRPSWFIAGVALMLAGALAGFMVHNWTGKIFLGDAGSYFVGLLMASLTAKATFYEAHLGGRHVVLAPLCILAVPLYDFASVMTIRLRHGRSPFRPDKSHFSHRLVELGLTPPRAVLTIHLATLTTGLAGLVLYQVPGWTGAWLTLAMVGGVLAIVAILETTGRRGRNPQPAPLPVSALPHAPSEARPNSNGDGRP